MNKYTRLAMYSSLILFFLFLYGCAQPKTIGNVSPDANTEYPEETTGRKNAAPKMSGEKIYVFGKRTPVIFPHKQHQDAQIACSECHTGNVAKMMAIDKDTGHYYCISCHRASNLGAKCAICHS